jgi:predicted AlkP superfamily phosphohydrolase/phosphomutase
MIGIDGASPRLVDPLMAAGRLPNLAELARDGAYGALRSAQPIDSPRLWNTIVTGKVPRKHGIRHFAHTGEEGRNVLFLSTDRKVHALWNIVSDAGMRVGVVNFWNTYPPELVDGVMVSDHLLARNIESRVKMTRSSDVPTGPVIHPTLWRERLSRLLSEHRAMTSFENPLRNNPELPRYLGLAGDDLPRRFEEDEILTAIAREIDVALRPELLMVLLPGIDRTSHFLWGSLEDQNLYPEELRLDESERAASRAALERYYEFTDALIGILVRDRGPGDLVVVLSDHGFEAGRGMGLLSGVHESEAALDGVLFARGRGIAPGSSVVGMAIEDVTPTLLAWMGLPVGADMDGAPASILGNLSHATVATHDTGPVRRMALAPSGAEDEIVDQLRRLGYLE